MKLTFYKYRLPFSSSLITSKTTYNYRKGFILEYQEGDFYCYSEAAPLPGFSAETLGDVQKKIISTKDELKIALASADPDSLQSLYTESGTPPSLRFALDSLAWQLKARNKDKSLKDFLFESPVKEVPVNAVVSLHSDPPLSETEQFISKGFKTIKFKIGLDFEHEYKWLAKIREAFPGLTIRVDANKSWTFDEAVRCLDKLQQLDIEYCEEPLNNPTTDNYQKLSQEVNIPLALDESLSQQANWQSLLPFVSVLILKPMVLGSFSKIFVTKSLADTHDNKIVLTSSLESGIGRVITSALASGLGSPDLAQGLNTSQFLAQNIYDDKSYIKNGSYDLSSFQKWVKIPLNNLQNMSIHII